MQAVLITTLLVVSSVSCVSAGGADIFFWMSDATTTLALKVQQKLRNESNLAIAPFGLHSILSLALRGAREDTALELLTLLNWQSHMPGDLFYFYAGIFSQLNQQQNEIANAILAGQNISIDPSFLDEVKKFYQALVISGDPKNAGKAETEINEFVANRTHGFIQTIIPRGSITDKSSLVLASSLTYQERWQLRFDPSKTQKQSFFKNDGTIIQVDMMKDTRATLYKKDNQLAVDIVHIPLNNTRNGVLLVIPHQRMGLSELEEDLLRDPRKLNSLFNGLVMKTVELALPKFKIETKLDLKDNLRELGMVKASTPNVADFSGFENIVGKGSTMWPRPQPTSFQNLTGATSEGRNSVVPESPVPLSPANLYISNVYHSITLEINEFGLLASSSPDTRAQDSPTMVADLDSAPLRARVVADRPFMFFLGRFQSYPWIKIQGRFSGF